MLVQIISGGWNSSPPRGVQTEAVQTYLDAGISVISIDYRLTPQHTVPSQMEDTVARCSLCVPWRKNGTSTRTASPRWVVPPEHTWRLGWRCTTISRNETAFDPVERYSSRLACFAALSGPMDLTRVRPTELARQPLRGQDFANAFTAAFGCTAEQFEQDPTVQQRIRDASPLLLATPTIRRPS